MTTDLLRLVQWLSPSFPLGSFAYSHGLETAIATGQVTSAASLQNWLGLVLRRGAGATDAVLLCLSQNGADLSETAQSLASSRERLEETMAQGRAFVATVNAIEGTDYPAAPLPVAVGVAARGLSVTPAEVAALYLHSFASNLISCAVRFVPLGQSEGQAVLAALHDDIETTAKWAATATLDDIGSAAFGADMAAMAHETQDVRIFKT